MFEKITPEQAGISSKSVLKFFNSIEKHGVTMHSMLLMKGDKLFAEGYYAPFTQDFCHRMYSQTKSYVSIAIGLLEEDGKIDCPCHSGRYELRFCAEGIEVFCTECGASHVFNTSAVSASEEYITIDSLTLE